MKEAHYDAGGRPNMNHFVVGVPTKSRSAGEVAASPASVAPAASCPRNVFVAAMAAGFGIVPTVRDGKCCAETMCIVFGVCPAPATMKALRLGLRRER